MQVGLVFLGWVCVDDQVNAFDVDAARCDVGGYQNPGGA
jgi:hypothetical protein